MNQVGEIQCLKLLLGVVQHPRTGRVAGQDAAFEVRDGNADGGMVEDAAKPLLAFAQSILGVLAFSDVHAGARHPERHTATRTIEEIHAADPGHPADFAARYHEAEIHLELAAVHALKRRLVLRHEERLVVSVHPREGVIDVGAASWKAQHREQLGRAGGAAGFKIDGEGAYASGGRGQAQPLLAFLQGCLNGGVRRRGVPAAAGCQRQQMRRRVSLRYGRWARAS